MIKKVAVIGAGVMGSGIAAHIASQNIDVILYDLKNEEGLIASKALDKLLTSTPAALTTNDKVKKITPASIKDDLNLLVECDLVIEVIVEKLAAKQNFYKEAAKHLQPHAFIASNTSTFKLEQLTSGLPEEVANRIIITHFFNPPRYMRLLEFVISNNHQEKDVAHIKEFLENKLGKYVINCFDTPGFIANRAGCFLLELAKTRAINAKADIAKIDNIFTKLLGFPSTGIFGLLDLIGLDVMNLISSSLISSLNEGDYFKKIYIKVTAIDELIEKGYKGRKGLGGFYRLTVNEKEKVKLKLSFINFEYENYNSKEAFELKNTKELFASSDQESKLATTILCEFFWYVLTITEEIAANIYDIDKAMTLGYSWKWGPFELMNLIGLDNIKSKFIELGLSEPKFLSKLENSKIDNKLFLTSVPQLDFIKNNNSNLLLSNNSANLWLAPNNSLVFELKTKMNVLNDEVFHLIIDSVNLATEKNNKLIIYSDAKHFSAGADLNFFLNAAKSNNFSIISQRIKLGQRAMLVLKNAKIPVISCARGFALGGGCELLLHSHYVVAFQELTAGLVECGIGLVPGWGGLKEMILKSSTLEDLSKNLKTILLQYKSTSAEDFAIKYNHTNLISLASPNELLTYALKKDFALPNNNRENYNYSFKDLIIDLEKSDDHLNFISESICKKLSEIKEINEENLCNLEHDIFLDLLKMEKTLKLIEKILAK